MIGTMKDCVNPKSSIAMVGLAVVRLIIVLFVIQIISLSCFGQDSIVSEIKELKTDSLKQNFLEKIFTEDQKYEIQSLHLKDSDSIGKKNFYVNWQKMDTLHVKKILEYLAYYKYPEKENVGEIANMTPWLVIHHTGIDTIRFTMYHLLTNAFKEGKLAEDLYREYIIRTILIYQKKRKKNYNEAYHDVYEKKTKTLQKKMKTLYDRNNSKH